MRPVQDTCLTAVGPFQLAKTTTKQGFEERRIIFSYEKIRVFLSGDCDLTTAPRTGHLVRKIGDGLSPRGAQMDPAEEVRDRKRQMEHIEMLRFVADSEYGIPRSCVCGGRIIDEVRSGTHPAPSEEESTVLRARQLPLDRRQVDILVGETVCRNMSWSAADDTFALIETPRDVCKRGSGRYHGDGVVVTGGRRATVIKTEPTSSSQGRKTRSGGVMTRASHQSADMGRSVGTLATALTNLNLSVFPQDGTILGWRYLERFGEYPYSCRLLQDLSSRRTIIYKGCFVHPRGARSSEA
ncbi:hypothetical protein Bca52824_035355 [Brassica carinata]|uniref:Uncharacterized protein n=1 Tax=Brassica carinata TaxID=52824 RepID=A0A8X7S0G7_BRACI|nr:hypothetical protein Bca52824_035355 [Brassica carinata]